MKNAIKGLNQLDNYLSAIKYDGNIICTILSYTPVNIKSALPATNMMIAINHINYQSNDGEYRENLVGYSDFLSGINSLHEKYPSTFDSLERIALSRILAGDVVYDTYGNDRKIEDHLNKVIENSRLVVYIMMTVLMRISIVMSSIGASTLDKEVYDQLRALYKENPNYIKETSEFKSFTTRIGLKMVPTSVEEIRNPLDIRYKLWMELHCATQINSLIMNYIAMGFPLLINWFIFPGNEPFLWNNKIQIARMQNSIIADQIVGYLERLKQSTYTLKDRDIFINYEFEILSNEYIQAGINYAERDLVITRNILGMIFEQMSITFATMATYDNFAPIAINYPTAQKYHTKFIFELAYNLLALNVKAGIIHSDLHLGNVALAYNYDLGENHMDIYHIYGKTYYVPAGNYRTSIIDFSRAIIYPEYLPEDVREQIDRMQCNKIVAILSREFQDIIPDIMNKLRKLYRASSVRLYDLMTAYDISRFSKALAGTTEKIMPHITILCRSIEDFALKYINDIFAGIPRKNINLEIISEFFEYFTIPSKTDIPIYFVNEEKDFLIISVSNIENPIREPGHELDNIADLIAGIRINTEIDIESNPTINEKKLKESLNLIMKDREQWISKIRDMPDLIEKPDLSKVDVHTYHLKDEHSNSEHSSDKK